MCVVYALLSPVAALLCCSCTQRPTRELAVENLIRGLTKLETQMLTSERQYETYFLARPSQEVSVLNMVS